MINKNNIYNINLNILEEKHVGDKFSRAIKLYVI